MSASWIIYILHTDRWSANVTSSKSIFDALFHSPLYLPSSRVHYQIAPVQTERISYLWALFVREKENFLVGKEVYASSRLWSYVEHIRRYKTDLIWYSRQRRDTKQLLKNDRVYWISNINETILTIFQQVNPIITYVFTIECKRSWYKGIVIFLHIRYSWKVSVYFWLDLKWKGNPIPLM
jgi:hypothetical protein